MESPVSDGTQARRVCRFCKARKRRCDKILPSCSACLRRRLKCDYGSPQNDQPESPAADGFQFTPADFDEHNSADLHPIDYPTALFLDPSLLQHGQLDLVQRTVTVPKHIHDLLGDSDDVALAVMQYLQHNHRWLPFLSKIRLQHFLQRFPHNHADVTLLLLAIKLIATSPPVSPRNPRTSLYHAVKHFHLEVEGSCLLSLPTLQAAVLVSLYEISHGIYPAAFLSIAGCARFANAMGINVNQAVGSKKALTLFDREERGRVWWVIVTLDRFVTIGCPGRPLATPDPEMHDFLPADDGLWDEGIVRPEDYSTISAPLTAHMGKFALLCQAARLLGHVFSAVWDTTPDGDEAWLQLYRTLQSMLTASLEVESPDYGQITFVYSALTALCAPWLPSAWNEQSTPDNTGSRHASLYAQQLVDKINANLVEAQCLAYRDPDDMPPWGLFFAYRICFMHLGSTSSSISRQVSDALRALLERINARWNVAGVYLQLLEAHEVMLMSSTRSKN